MEDSLEDYIKISRNISEEPITLKKDIQITALRKNECDKRAMKIVEFSIEGKLRPEIFIKCLPYITQSHYQDIVEERAVTKLCGYSVCGKRIPEMPKKQYYISTKNNKVYDITDRKNYCSNICYKASIHIKKQINDSPLWLRKFDDIPEYQLLESSDSGLPGEFIDQGIAKPIIENKFTPISIFTHVSLQDMVDNEKGQHKNATKNGSNRKLSKSLKSTMQTINESVEQFHEDDEEKLQLSQKENVASSSKDQHSINLEISRTKDLPVIDETDELETSSKVQEIWKSTSSSIGSKDRNVKKRSSKDQKVDVESVIKTVLKEWLTIESYIFLFGEEKIKEVLDEKKLSDYFDKLNIAELKREQQIKYLEICKRLHLQEMADEKFDKAFLGNTKIMPLPDYQKLKTENKELSIKVKCFYTGVLQERDHNYHMKNSKEYNENKEDEPPAVLPLVDVNSQTALRRKIFLSSITKSMQQLLQGLRIRSITPILSDLHALVKTFRLTAHNIVFKPFMWNCIAVVLLNMLSIRDENLRLMLQEKSSKEFTDLFIGLLPNKDFLSQILISIRKIDSFVEEYISYC